VKITEASDAHSTLYGADGIATLRGNETLELISDDKQAGHSQSQRDR
jgi:hypothetical protein